MMLPQNWKKLFDFIYGKEQEDELTRELDEAVQYVRKNEEWRALDMSVKHRPKRSGEELYDIADELSGKI